MTQEKANEIFNTDLGRQLNEIYVTSDDRAFVRNEEAVKHVNGELDPNTQPLEDKTITIWYPEEGDYMEETKPLAFPDSALVDTSNVKYIPIKEFRELGYLQELNRRFLHPLGMALSIQLEKDGSETVAGIWDCREDKEGVYYNIAESDEARKELFRKKFDFVDGEMGERLGQRGVILGFGIEPIPGK